MTSKIPQGLKPADISRFAQRAVQLEKFKPVISYWCEYYIVNQIIAKGLHTADEECMQYTTTLMDKLEQTKAQYPDNDAILDDVAAKVYVEQFALETFQRADNSVRANKASAQTADTFRAAATFLDLLAVWGPLDPELAAKSKFAKYHALRIAKALKAGEDPNLSNPVQESEPADDEPAPALDPNDPEVQRINGTASLQPTVESASPSLAPSPSQDFGTSASAAHADVSPLEAAAAASAEDTRQNSVGGGYFPAVPTFTSEGPAPSLPTAPEQTMDDASSPASVAAPSSGPFAGDPQDYYQPPPSAPTALASPPPAPPAAVPQVMPVAGAGFPAPAPRVPVTGEAYRTDDDAVMQAQKHAKWAISALNFEDVPTAVKELRIALEALGAR